GDLDGDGKEEVVNALSRTVWEIRNPGGGLRSSSPSLGSASGIQVVDLDGDGKLEIAGTESWFDRVFVLGQGMKRRWWHSTGEDPVGPVVGDLDGDGKKEIVVGSILGNVNCYSSKGESRWVTGTQLPLSKLALLRMKKGPPVILVAGARALVFVSTTGTIIDRLSLPSSILHVAVVREKGQPDSAVIALKTGLYRIAN
ncbi:MAG: VCBS repeat-containing protein, partial [Planctomycetota bacterium]|nr:VCBS repeat-containing protein [Planctomycetota bacterium]